MEGIYITETRNDGTHYGIIVHNKGGVSRWQSFHACGVDFIMDLAERCGLHGAQLRPITCLPDRDID